jgi:hypothetical protein
MCFSPCVVHVTREALVQRQLLQCRTCGSQAFHILDCCRDPDYGRVPTPPLGERLKAWLGAVRTRMRASALPPRLRPAQPVSPAALDAWEARPLTLRDTGVDKAMEEVEDVTLSAMTRGGA